jgi:hypothetical protein
MNSRIAGWVCFVVFLAIAMLASGARAQAPYQAPVKDQGQAPPKEEQSKPKEFGKVFCAERSAAIRYMMVNAVNCSDVCDNVYQEYPCELQQRLRDGWKVTSVSVATIEVQRDPCDCGVTGTESVLERSK